MTAREIVTWCQTFEPYLEFRAQLARRVPRLASWHLTVSRLNKEKCFCVDRNSQGRKCACEIHVQLGYFLEALSVWRRSEHGHHSHCDCECEACVDNHVGYQAVVSNSSAFSQSICNTPECAKDDVRNCRPLRCALGKHAICNRITEPLLICPNDYASARLVRYKTQQPVKSGGKVFDDWVYQEATMRQFIQMVKSFYKDKYRLHNWIYKWQEADRSVMYYVLLRLYLFM